LTSFFLGQFILLKRCRQRSPRSSWGAGSNSLILSPGLTPGNIFVILAQPLERSWAKLAPASTKIFNYLFTKIYRLLKGFCS